jgi:hypothetical protein
MITRSPSWLPARILEQFGSWKLPPLQGVITAPTMRLDGSLLTSPGYDAETGLYLKGSRFSPPIGGGVQEALATLWAPVRLFPFADEVSKAVYLTALLTGVVRKVLPSAPGFVLDAPKAGTGKTLACFCAQILATGVARALIAKKDAEFTKTLDAELLAGSASIFFDNVKEDLNAQLEAVLTAPTYAFRVLGVSKTVTVSTRSLFLISSNN